MSEFMQRRQRFTPGKHRACTRTILPVLFRRSCTVCLRGSHRSANTSI